MGRKTGRPKGLGVGLPKNSALPLDERIRTFWSLVDMRGESECWEWMGNFGSHGYGIFSFNGTRTTAQRFSWFAHYKQWPSKPYICHRCDNRKCVNPKHLFEGTALDNNHDAIAKGRVRHWGRPKIKPDVVAQIRETYSAGNHTYKTLAELFGLKTTQIFSALHKWKTLNQYGLQT